MKVKRENFGWGRFTKMISSIVTPQTTSDLVKIVQNHSSIVRGQGLSYGDSAMADFIISMNEFRTIRLDEEKGILECEAGVKIRDLTEAFMSRGWILPVTPGSSLVTIGGAIAADVHGKNHFHFGSFCDHLISIVLMLGNGEIIEISRDKQSDLFYATCGGMGLTGMILSCKIQMRRIQSSWITQKTLFFNQLDELLLAFKANQDQEYAIAWMNFSNTKNENSILYLGNHRKDLNYQMRPLARIKIPFELPDYFTNSTAIKCFNTLYEARQRRNPPEQIIHLYESFYQLDAVDQWNLILGPKGFIQYQAVLPGPVASEGLKKIISTVKESGHLPFLATIKRMGKSNKNLLSFPLEGYTIAMDFKASAGIGHLTTRLDDIIKETGGRIYLAKDSLMASETFKICYPKWMEFEKVREKYGAIGKFSSLQSKRLGLK